MPPFDFLARSKQKYTSRGKDKDKDVPGSPDSFFSPPLPPVPPPIHTLPPPSVAFPYSNTRFPWPLGHHQSKPQPSKQTNVPSQPKPSTSTPVISAPLPSPHVPAPASRDNSAKSTPTPSGGGLQLDVDLSFSDSLFDGLSIFDRRRSGVSSTKSGLPNVTPPAATATTTPGSNSPSLHATRLAPTPPAPLQIPSKSHTPSPSRLPTAAPTPPAKSTTDLNRPSGDDGNGGDGGPPSPSLSYVSYTSSYSGSGSSAGSVCSYASAPDLDIDYFGLSSAVLPTSSRANLSPENAGAARRGNEGAPSVARNKTWSRKSHRLTRQDSAVLPVDPWWFAIQGERQDTANGNGKRSRKPSLHSKKSRRNSIASTYESTYSSTLAALNLSTPTASFMSSEGGDGTRSGVSSFYGGGGAPPTSFGAHPPSSFAASASRRNSVRHASGAKRRQRKSLRGGSSRPGSAGSSAPPSAFPAVAGAGLDRATSTWSMMSSASGTGSTGGNQPHAQYAQGSPWSYMPGSAGRFPSPVEPMPEGAAQIAAEASRVARQGIEQVLLAEPEKAKGPSLAPPVVHHPYSPPPHGGPGIPRSYSSPPDTKQQQATITLMLPPPPPHLTRSHTAPSGLDQMPTPYHQGGGEDKDAKPSSEGGGENDEKEGEGVDDDDDDHAHVTLDSVLEGYNTPIAIKHHLLLQQQIQKLPPRVPGASIIVKQQQQQQQEEQRPPLPRAVPSRSRSASAAPPFRSEMQGGGVVERKAAPPQRRKMTEPALVTAGYVSADDGEGEEEGGDEYGLGDLASPLSSSPPPGAALRRTSRIMSLSPAQRASLLLPGQTHSRTGTMGSFISPNETEVYPNPNRTPPPPPPLPGFKAPPPEGEYVMVDKKTPVDQDDDSYVMHQQHQSIMLTPPFARSPPLPDSPRESFKGSPRLLPRAATPDSGRSLGRRSPRPLPSPLTLSRPTSLQESVISSPPHLSDSASAHAAAQQHEGDEGSVALARKGSGLSKTESRNDSSGSLPYPRRQSSSQSHPVQTPTSSISNYSTISSSNSPIAGPISMSAAAVVVAATTTTANATAAVATAGGRQSVSTLSLNSSTQSLSQPSSSIPGSTRRRISFNHQFMPDGTSPVPNHRLSAANAATVGTHHHRPPSAARMLPIGKQQPSTGPAAAVFERARAASETTPRPSKKDGGPHRPAPLPLRHGKPDTESFDFPETPAMFSPIPSPPGGGGPPAATRGRGRGGDHDDEPNLASLTSPSTFIPVPPRNMMPLPPVIENVPPAAKKRVMGPRERPPGPAGPRKQGSSGRVPQQPQTGGGSSDPSTGGRTTPALGSGPAPHAQITPPPPPALAPTPVPPPPPPPASPPPPAQSTSATVSPGSTTLPPPTSLQFQSRQVGWKGLTMEAAKWTFTSSQLQEIVGRAIRQTAESSSIRLLTVEQLDAEIPQEIQRLEAVQQDIIQQYHAAVKRRQDLFGALAAGDPQARAELHGLCVSCDQLTEDLFHVMDELSQLHRLRDLHSASALGMALRKLNSSFLKQTEAATEMSKNVTQLEAEKEEAWATAERVEREMMEMQAKYEALLMEGGSPGMTTNGTGTPASSARSSRVSAARKTSVRASKASLRLSRGTRLSIASNIHSALPSAMPPVPPMPTRARGFASPRSLSVNTDLATGSEYSTNESNSPTRALAEAQKELYDMLGLSPAESRTASRYLSMTSPGLYRRTSEVHSPASLPASPFAPAFQPEPADHPPLRRNASFTVREGGRF